MLRSCRRQGVWMWNKRKLGCWRHMSLFVLTLRVLCERRSTVAIRGPAMVKIRMIRRAVSLPITAPLFRHEGSEGLYSGCISK
jgi:hypothetical protein